MSTPKQTDGGSAFPEHPLPHDHCWYVGSTGMSLRDHFAGLAMQEILEDVLKKLTTKTVIDPQDARLKIAEESYQMADAMLARRERKEAE